MGLKKTDYLKKIAFIFAILLAFLGIFRLNVQKFFSLKQETENSLYQKDDKFAFLSMEHIGVIFENKELNIAIFVLPDTGYQYNISEFSVGYKKQQKFIPNINLTNNTIYFIKEDTSCIYEETCGENFGKILKSAEKYNMMPQAYDLTDKIILSDNNNIVVLKNK